MDDLMRDASTVSPSSSAGQPQHSQTLPAHDDEPPSYDSISSDRTLIPPQTVHIDGVLVFPSEPPANALYQLSRDLVAGTRISIGRIDHEIIHLNSGPTTRIKDRPIYVFAHQIFDDSTIDITGKRRDGFSCLAMFRKGETWTVCTSSTSGSEGVHGQTVFECKSTKKWFKQSPVTHEWRDPDGQVLAVEDRLILESRSRNMLIGNPSFRILVPLEQRLVDLLVTAWCARIWNHNLKTSGQIRTLSKGKNARFPGGKS